MAFDGLVTKSVVYELNNSLVGGKIDKIFCPSSDAVSYTHLTLPTT